MKDIPKCVQSIVGETYLFEIRIKEKDFQTSYQNFTVSKIHKHIKVTRLHMFDRFIILYIILNLILYFSYIQSTPVDSNLGNKRKEREEENQKEESENLRKKPHV